MRARATSWPSSLRWRPCRHMQAGQPDDALPMATEVFGAHLEILGQDHPSTLVSMTNLAQVHMAMRNDENAVSLFRDALSLQRRAGGDADESTLTTVALLGELLGLMGQHTEAVLLLEEGAAGWLQLGGSGHPQTQKCTCRSMRGSQRIRCLRRTSDSSELLKRRAATSSRRGTRPSPCAERTQVLWRFVPTKNMCSDCIVASVHHLHASQRNEWY